MPGEHSPSDVSLTRKIQTQTQSYTGYLALSLEPQRSIGHLEALTVLLTSGARRDNKASANLQPIPEWVCGRCEPPLDVEALVASVVDDAVAIVVLAVTPLAGARMYRGIAIVTVELAAPDTRRGAVTIGIQSGANAAT